MSSYIVLPGEPALAARTDHTAWQMPGLRGLAHGPLTGSLGRLPPSRVAEYPVDGPTRPAHPFGRGRRVLAELLRHPPGAAPAAELAHGRRDRLPDLPGAGLIGLLK